MSPTQLYHSVKSVIIDFDSVICGVESMDVLFEELLKDWPADSRRETMAEVKRITDSGMAGEMSFSESLKARLALLPREPAPMTKVSKRISECISKSFVAALPRWNSARINVISSGFRQLIEPALTGIGFPAERIHCNTLMFDEKGVIRGVDETNPLSRDSGKVAVVRELAPPREIAVVGDGYTDWQITESGEADYFFAYAEFVRRESVLKHAREVLTDFHQLGRLIDLT